MESILTLILALIPMVTLAEEAKLSLLPRNSVVREFNEPPTQAFLDDQTAFSVNRIENKVVIHAKKAGSGNAFFFFKGTAPYIFKIQASVAITTPSVSFEHVDYPPRPEPPPKTMSSVLAVSKSLPASTVTPLGIELEGIEFDTKRDYLVVRVRISNSAYRKVAPLWERLELRQASRKVKPSRIRASRREVLRDSSIKASFEFERPGVPADLHDITLNLPVRNATPLVLSLEQKKGEK